ncbi:DUF5658 family protein [Lysinibacillus sp. LZ02]|uniref:DUF5658 family protein n=1 Tax=Lysinibacillus sp. LZ02 TaxID=3420668 RepID=UPI003D36B5A3
MKNKVKLIYVSWLVAMLNIVDGFATHYGLVNGVIEELNPIMDFIWLKSPLLFLSIKTVLSLVLIAISNVVYKTSHVAFQKSYLALLMVLFLLYVGVLVLHITWFVFV